MWIVTRLRIGKEKVFFSVGPMELLEKIQEHSSIKRATEAMGMSYTKALRIIRIMEDELGFLVVESKKGGSQRGTTILTEKGKKVLTAFQDIYEDVSAYAQKQLDEKFKF